MDTVDDSGRSLLPPLNHPFWQEEDVAETVLSTVADLERSLSEAESILTEQEARGMATFLESRTCANRFFGLASRA